MYNPYDSEKYPRRKHPRLKHYDYSKSNYYFVTVCTYEKNCIFGLPGSHNRYGKLAENGILKIPEHYSDVQIDAYAVMPNHVHILIYLPGGKAKLETIIGTWKAYVTREIHKFQPEINVWQASFHDHIIRDEKSYQNIWLYIKSNPMNWEKDCFYIT